MWYFETAEITLFTVTPFTFLQPWVLCQHNIQWEYAGRTGDHSAREELQLWIKLNIQHGEQQT